MNIAFYTYGECVPTLGGTERTTSIMAEALTKYFRYNIFSIYSQPSNVPSRSDFFCDSFRLDSDDDAESKLVSFIKDNNLRVIINQGDFDFGKLFSGIIVRNGLNCRQFFALHFAPGAYEENHINFYGQLNNLKKKLTLSGLAKIGLFPLYHFVANRLYRKKYEEIINCADKIVLLSEGYIDEWIAYSRSAVAGNERGKFKIIPNAITYPLDFSQKGRCEKEKRILIVSRLLESQKKISKAIEIWEKISSCSEMLDWSLDIVGDGEDRLKYEQMVEKRRIPRVTFYGRREPSSFYQRASVFLMTSDFEGWPMTLMEAMQFGVVPIAYDSYSALADVIKNGENGFRVKKNDSETFADEIIRLVKNPEELNKMSHNAKLSINSFAPEKIAEKWNKLLQEDNV